jgi:hypothetical protein
MKKLVENKCVSPKHAECFSKLLLKDQSWAFADVKFEWFGHKVVPKVGLHGSLFKNVGRRI